MRLRWPTMRILQVSCWLKPSAWVAVCLAAAPTKWDQKEERPTSLDDMQGGLGSIGEATPDPRTDDMDVTLDDAKRNLPRGSTESVDSRWRAWLQVRSSAF